MTLRRARPVARRGGGRAERPGPARERRRRATAGRLAPVRAGAILVMVLALLAGWGLAASPAFAFRELELVDAERLLTDRAAIEAAVGGIAAGESVFAVAAGRIEEALEALPTVRAADVAVGLPGTLRIALDEREPVLAWVVGETRYAVDETGRVLAATPAGVPGAAARLVPIVDRRAGIALAIGATIDPLLLDAATRIGSLTPADVGSARERATVVLDDRDGFTLRLAPGGPIAVFGFYTPSLRPPAIVPGQARLLRSILDGREDELGWVILASETNGTYLAKGVKRAPDPTPRPSATPAPTPSASADPSPAPSSAP
ncbi:MAG: hypothetical protein RL338_919 [Chloroflexota bacterium]